MIGEMKTLASLGRKFWRWYITPPQITPASRMRDWAWAFWITPTIGLCPFIILPLLMDFTSAMRAVIDAWQIYLFFIALPYLAGALCWAHARRIERGQ